MSKTKKVLAFLGVPAAVGLAVVLSLGGGASAAGVPPVATLAAGVTATADDVAAYNKLVDQISGTPEQRKLGAELPTAQIDQYMTTCMAMSSGHFTYNKGHLHAAAYRVGLSDYDFLATPFHNAADVKALAETVQEQNDDTPHYKEAGYTAAIKACEASMPAKQYSQSGRPQSRIASADTDFARAKAAELGAVSLDLDKKLAQLKASAVGKQLLAGYNNCLQQHGYNFKNGDGLVNREGLAAAVWGKFLPLNGRSWNELNGNSQWEAAVKFEQNAAAADASCREAADGWAVESLQPVIKFYLGDARVASLATNWAAIQQNAAAVGLK